MKSPVKYLTAVIPTRNRPKDIIACVSALLPLQTVNEVIIADDSDESILSDPLIVCLIDAFRAAGKMMAVVRPPVQSVSYARAYAAALASNEFVLTLDDDNIVATDFHKFENFIGDRPFLSFVVYDVNNSYRWNDWRRERQDMNQLYDREGKRIRYYHRYNSHFVRDVHYGPGTCIMRKEDAVDAYYLAYTQFSPTQRDEDAWATCKLATRNGEYGIFSSKFMALHVVRIAEQHREWDYSIISEAEPDMAEFEKRFWAMVESVHGAKV